MRSMLNKWLLTATLLLTVLVLGACGMFTQEQLEALNPEFRVEDGMIQYRLEGEVTWLDLFSASSLRGDDGEGIEAVYLNAEGHLVFVTTAGDEINVGSVIGVGEPGIPGQDGVGIMNASISAVGDLLITLTNGQVVNAGSVISFQGIQGPPGLRGPQGEPGREVEFRLDVDHIQWRYVGASLWINLIAVSDLEGNEGAPGQTGAPGIDGREVEFNASSTHLQFRYSGDVDWIDIFDLVTLRGAQGPQGETGEQGPVGPEGPQGAPGAQGPQGETGEQGPVGPEGPQGAPGAEGQDGQDGRDVIIRVEEGILQWQSEGDGDNEWNDLINLGATQTVTFMNLFYDLIGKNLLAYDLLMLDEVGLDRSPDFDGFIFNESIVVQLSFYLAACFVDGFNFDVPNVEMFPFERDICDEIPELYSVIYGVTVDGDPFEELDQVLIFLDWIALHNERSFFRYTLMNPLTGLDPLSPSDEYVFVQHSSRNRLIRFVNLDFDPDGLGITLVHTNLHPLGNLNDWVYGGSEDPVLFENLVIATLFSGGFADFELSRYFGTNDISSPLYQLMLNQGIYEYVDNALVVTPGSIRFEVLFGEVFPIPTEQYFVTTAPALTPGGTERMFELDGWVLNDPEEFVQHEHDHDDFFSFFQTHPNLFEDGTDQINLTAVWTELFTVRFEDYDGTLLKSQVVRRGDGASAPDDPSRTGHIFDGWSISFSNVTSNLTVTAEYTVRSYTITFNSDGGSSVSSITRNFGASVTAPTNPTRTGYSFTGWSPALPSTMPANDLNVTAQWTANAYNVTFNANGGTGSMPAQSITFDSSADLNSNAFTRAGFTFAGWTTLAGGGGASYSNNATFVMDVEGITLYAQWTPIQYSIEYILNGGTDDTSNPSTYTVLSNTITLQAPSRFGHSFEGWYSDANFNTSVSTIEQGSIGNITLYARWSANTYQVTFDGNGATSGTMSNQNYTFGATANLFGNGFSRTGHTFTGWNTQPDGSGDAYSSSFTMNVEGIKLYAQWSINEYTITFDSNGGTSVDSITQNFGTSVEAPSNPTRTGFTFTGWSQTVPTTMPAENITLVASWTANEYTITFNSDGGTAVSSITQDFGTAVTRPSDPTRDGFTFDGWSPDVPSTMPAENLTLTAQWSANNYTITFDSNGGTSVSSITQAFGTSITAPDDPTREGFTFNGWNPSVPSTMPSSDRTLTAQWTPINYNISIELIGPGAGSFGTSGLRNVGQSITINVQPEENFRVKSVTVIALSNESTLSVSEISSTSYTFTMPASNVRVTIELEEIPENFELFAGGRGTQNDPFQIETWEHLRNVDEELDAYFILNNDLDSNTAGYDTFVQDSGWLPLNTFTGSFDGNENSILNLSILSRRGSIANVGLFSEVNGGEVKDLTLSGSVSIGVYNDNVALMAGRAVNATLTNIVVEGSVTAIGLRVAGLIGSTEGNVTLENVVNNATVTNNVNTTRSGTGGLIGGVVDSTNLTILNSQNTGSVIGPDYVGGFIGYVFGTSTNLELTVTNSTNSGSITQVSSSTNPAAGGLIGAVGSGVTGEIILNNFTNTGALSTESGNNVNNIIGRNIPNISVVDNSEPR